MPVLASCPVCGRKVVVHDGRLRAHKTPDGARATCPGSGGKVSS